METTVNEQSTKKAKRASTIMRGLQSVRKSFSFKKSPQSNIVDSIAPQEVSVLATILDGIASKEVLVIDTKLFLSLDLSNAYLVTSLDGIKEVKEIKNIDDQHRKAIMINLANQKQITNYIPLSGIYFNLSSIDLTNCGLKGIPFEIKALAKLRELTLDNNPGLIFKEDDLQLMPHLKLLSACSNNIETLPSRLFAPVEGKESNLETISLKNNQLSNFYIYIKELPLSKLKRIHLEGNPISQDEQKEIQSYLTNKPTSATGRQFMQSFNRSSFITKPLGTDVD